MSEPVEEEASNVLGPDSQSNGDDESEPMIGKQPSLGEDDKGTGKGLERTLTLTKAVNMIVGCIIGSGIFVSPTGIQIASGSVGSSLLMWVLCGVWCGLGSYIYAELGAMITKSGGDYAYIMEAFGPFLAFLRFWIESIVVRPCAITVVALTFALYALRPMYPTCATPPLSEELLAGLLIVILGAINCWSVKLATIVQDWFTYAKGIALIGVIATGAYYWLTGFYAGLFAYQGWTYLNFITEEIINPKRNLPLAVMLSTVICTVLYTLFNVALYVVLSPDEMLISPAVAVLFAEKAWPKAAVLMPICVAISTVGSANGVIFSSSRLFYCAARERQMPNLLAMINKQLRTPIPSVLFTCIISILYLFLSSNLYVLINASQITAWLAITTVTIACLRLRCKYPDMERPVKVNLVLIIIFLIGSSCIVVLPVFGSPRDTALGLAILFSAVPLYIVFLWTNKVRGALSGCMLGFTKICQKLFMIVDDNDYD